MKTTTLLLAIYLIHSSSVSASDEILLEDFANPTHKWQEMNDPVMGGKSTGSFTISDDLGMFSGEVVDVPFLKAPGFIQARTVDKIPFPDVSSCLGIKLVVRSDESGYMGYRFSFGDAHAPGGKFFARGYKTNLEGVQNSFTEIVLPFSDFTDFWDDATGDPIHTCEEHSDYCPDERALKNMKTMAVWGEGVGGAVHLEIQSISAVGCFSSTDAWYYPRNILLGVVRQMMVPTMNPVV